MQWLALTIVIRQLIVIRGRHTVHFFLVLTAVALELVDAGMAAVVEVVIGNCMSEQIGPRHITRLVQNAMQRLFVET